MICRSRLIEIPVGIVLRFAALVIVLAVSTGVRTQLPTATILRVIKDASEAVVPNATVTARNLDTGQTRLLAGPMALIVFRRYQSANMR